MKKPIIVKLLSFLIAVCMFFNDFTVYATTPLQNGVVNPTLSGNNLSDNTFLLEKEYIPYWKNDANFSNLIVFIEFADTGKEHGYDPAYTVSFNGDDDNQGIQEYFYQASYGKLKIENIIPQYSVDSEPLKSLRLDKNASDYVENGSLHEKKFLQDVASCIQDSELLTEEMNLHYSDEESSVLDYLTIVLPTGVAIETAFTSYDGCYDEDEAIMIGDVTVHQYGLVNEQELLGEEDSVRLQEQFWKRFGYVNYTNIENINYPTADFRSSQLGWFEIPVITQSKKSYTLVDTVAATKENADSQAVILKTSLSETEYFIIEYRKGISGQEGASDLFIYRVDTEATFGGTNEAERIKRFSYGDKLIYKNGDKSNILVENVLTKDGTVTFDVIFGKPEKLIVGWYKENGKTYYYDKNGNKKKGVIKIDGKNYYFDSNYELSTGWKKISNKYRFFNSSSDYKKCYELTYTGKIGGWITLSDGRKSYIHSSKGLLTGIQTISGKKYYFDSAGIMQKNIWKKSGDYYYYAGSDGSMVKGAKKIGTKIYYFDSNYRLSTGWKKINGKYRFFNNSSDYKKRYELSYTGKVGGWITLSDGRKSYIHLSKGLLKGMQTISGKKYYFDSAGIMQKNIWKKSGDYYYYAGSSGSMVKGVKKIGTKIYYFNSNYRLSAGWVKVSGKYRFFNDSSNYKNRYELTYTDKGNSGGWVTLSDGRKSYIHSTKGILKGWQTISSKKYYFNSRGIMVSGWQTIEGKKYFFNLSGIYIPFTKPEISSVTSSAYGRATIKWKAVTGADDFVVQYSTNSKFSSGVVTKKVNNTTTNQVTVTGLTAGKTYYFRVKYTVDGGNKNTPDIATSKYSAIKSTKIKGEVTATADSATVNTCKITAGSRDEGITVQFKATLKDRLKSADKKYYIVQTASYGTAIDVKTPCATVNKDFTVSVKMNITGSNPADTRDKVNRALMNKFALAIKKSDGTYQLVSTPKGITNPEFIAENTKAILKPASKKGLQGVGYADASDTNSKHTLFNIDLAKVVGTKAKAGYVEYHYKDKIYYFADCSNYVSECRQMAEGYEQYIQGMTGKKNKIAVTLNILLSYNSANSYLIDPAARKTGYRYYTLNVREEKARETFEAAFMYLGEVFGQEDCYVTHWILGNEVNSSKAYNYSGSLSQDQYMKCYAAAFRLLYNGVKASKTGNNVYISLDNGWCAAPDTYTGKATLDKFASYAQKENPSMLWSIAYHGYSYPLTRNDFWNDSKNTTNSTSTKYISMKNISVLTKYAATLEEKYSKPSGSIRVILSEQGYSAGKNGKYEESQAQALARGYYMAEFNSRIDAFIIRAIQDAEEETRGGLYLGIKDLYDEKRMAYYVYEYMDSNLSKFGKNNASKMVTSQNIKKYQGAQKILSKTDWKSIIPGFKESKLNAMY